MLYPISFCIPEEKIVNNIPNKTQLLAFCIPGNQETYIFDNEKEYYEDYQKSLFAITKKKAGWDCMRHYEILANGCIPLFENLDNCPQNTMIHFPKSILRDGEKLYNKIKDLSIQEIKNTYSEEYVEIVKKLLVHAKENLTTIQMVNYVLNKIPNTIKFNDQHNPQILFLSGNSRFGIMPDYLRCLLLHGFKQLFKNNCHDFPCIPHLYTDYPFDIKNLYGKGITYSKLLDKNIYRNDILDETLQQDILNKKYDLIIYGSCHRGMPFIDIILQIYHNEKNKVIFFCGEDEYECNLEKSIIENGFTLFKREF